MGLFGKAKERKISNAKTEKLKKENEEYAFNDFFNRRRIQELEDLCEEKDSWMDTMMSDGLRHGSSEAGRQMAYKREYKKRIRNNSLNPVNTWLVFLGGDVMLGVQFDHLCHTAKDWKLHFSALEIDEPVVQTFQLQVPGRNGLPDLTDSLFGHTTNLNRIITRTSGLNTIPSAICSQS